MPTGYTSKLYDGEQSFQDFALNCAKAFGAYVEFREDSSDGPIPPSKIGAGDPWNKRELAKAEREFAKLQELTAEQWQSRTDEHNREQLRSFEEGRAEEQARLARFNEMTEAVNKWKPPTKDHEEFKKFMLQQLGTEFEYGPHYTKPPKALTVAQFQAQAISGAKRDIKYHTDELKKEIERNTGRREWAQQLWDSVGASEPPHA
jgi:hypothetical protein